MWFVFFSWTPDFSDRSLLGDSPPSSWLQLLLKFREASVSNNREFKSCHKTSQRRHYLVTRSWKSYYPRIVVCFIAACGVYAASLACCRLLHGHSNIDSLIEDGHILTALATCSFSFEAFQQVDDHVTTVCIVFQFCAIITLIIITVFWEPDRQSEGSH